MKSIVSPFDEIVAAALVEHVGEMLVLVLGVAELQRPALGPPVVELRVVLGHHAVATVVVHGAVRDDLRELGREQQRHRGEAGCSGGIVVDGPRGLGHEEVRTRERCGHLGQAVLDRLERPDGHAELVPGLHVVEAELERAVGHAHEHRGDQHAPLVDGGGERNGRARRPTRAR